MKKILSLILSLTLCLALCACGGQKEMTALKRAQQEQQNRQRELDNANENLSRSQQALNDAYDLIDELEEIEDSWNP